MSNLKDTRDYRDGGYGWVVVGAAFLSSAISDGISFSYGLVLVDLVESFQSYRGQVALAGSLGKCFMSTGGLIAGPLSDIYGYRVVVVVGALISTTGLVTSCFVTELYHLYFTFGVVGGIGFGLLYIPPLICVVHNFKDRRSLANGIAMSGTGVGMFSINALVRYFLDMYGWRGTFMILGGITLQAAVGGLLLNSPSQTTRTSIGATTEGSDKRDSIEHAKVEDSDIKTADDEEDAHADISEARSVSHMQVPNPCKETLIVTENCCKDRLKHQHSLNTVNISVISNGQISGHSSDELTHNNESVYGNTLQNTDIEIIEEQQTESFGLLSKLKHIFIDTRTMFKDIKYLTFSIAIAVIAFGFLVPMYLLPDQASVIGIPKDRAFWITASLGIGNTGARLMFGWLGDRPWCDRFLLFLNATTLAGSVTILSCLSDAFEFKLAYGCVYGFLIGGYVGLAPVVLVDIVGADNMGKALGLYQGCMTLGFAFGGPLAGWIYDMSGNYNYSFILAGSFFLIGVAILSLPRCCYRQACVSKSKQRNQQLEREAQSEM